MNTLIQKYIQEQLDLYTDKYLNGQHFSQKYKNNYLKMISKGLRNETSCFYRYTEMQGQLETFEYAVPSKDLAKEFVAVIYLEGLQHKGLKDLKQTLQSMMSTYPKRKHLVIGLHPHQQNLTKKILKLKPEIIAYELLGKPKTALEYVNKMKANPEVTVRNVNAKKDLDDIMALEIKAHKADKTSRIKVFGKKFKDELTEHHKKMATLKSSFVAVKQGKIVGVIGTYPQKPIAIMATVSIDPKHQGQGLSKLLYQKALQDLVSRRCPFYKGMTTTQNVLSTSQKMGRKLSTTYYEINWPYST